MSVRLTAAQLAQIRQHGEHTFPEECGGLLLGVVEDGVRVILEVLPLPNIRQDSRHNRVELNPLDYARAERTARSSQIGFPDGASAECSTASPSASATTWLVAAVPKNWQPPPGVAQAWQPRSAASSKLNSPWA